MIGVLERQGNLFGFSLDNRAVAPAGSAMARFVNPPGVVDEILVRTDDSDRLDEAMLQIEAIMRTRHRLRPAETNDFEMATAEDSMSFWTRIRTVLLIAFPFLVGIALVVGGMVIMNIMLMSVVERTAEIGMRKAVGARHKDIMRQIVVESSALSLGGAALGIALGVGLAKLVEAVSPMPAAVAPHWLLIAATMGVLVGVLAGLYPASRAARLDPVVALRAE